MLTKKSAGRGADHRHVLGRNGIAKVDGMVIFVPYSAVGGQAACADRQGAETLQLRDYRPHFGVGRRTGAGQLPGLSPLRGCSFRHISYREELVHKAQFVEDNLRRLGGLEPQMLPITPSPKQQGYRNKAQYPIRMQDGKVTAGFFCQAQPSGDRLCLL